MLLQLELFLILSVYGFWFAECSEVMDCNGMAGFIAVL